MANRRAFWEWAFHASLEPGTAQSSRRKLNMRAFQARLAFTSTCIETWRFYVFMAKLDQHPEMFGLGGQPGRFSREARKYDAPVADDLAVLLEKNRKRYDATLEFALNPARMYAYGYPSVRVFLESTEALSPGADEKNRLTIAALARIRKDIMSSVQPKDPWIQDRSAEP